MKKTYVIPVCETVEIGNTTIMTVSKPNMSVKTSGDDDPGITDGGDTDSDSNKGTIFDPW